MDFKEQVVLWSLWIVSACIVLSAIAVGHAIWSRPGTVSIALKSDFKKLEWRSTYIDFDVLYGPNARGPRPTFDSFIQHAAVMAPVSRLYATRVYTPATTYALLPHEGYASMQSRRLLATDEVRGRSMCVHVSSLHDAFLDVDNRTIPHSGLGNGQLQGRNLFAADHERRHRS